MKFQKIVCTSALGAILSTAALSAQTLGFVTKDSSGDQGFVDVLSDAGYSVTALSVTTPAEATTVFNNAGSYDGLVFARSLSSGDFDNEDWNSLATPMLILNAYIVRDSRWGLFSDDSLTTTGSGSDVTATDAGDAFWDGVSGISADGDQTSGSFYTTNTSMKSGTTAISGGTIVGTVPGATAAARWLTGATVTPDDTATFSTTLAGERFYFAAGEDVGTDSDLYNLTALGESVFLNSADSLVPVPEPSHFAAVAGALALGMLMLRRRRG